MIPVLAVVAAASVLFALQVYRDTRWPVSPQSWRWAMFRFPRFSDAQLAWVVMEILYWAAVVTITIVFVGWLRLLGFVLAVLVIYGTSVSPHFSSDAKPKRTRPVSNDLRDMLIGLSHPTREHLRSVLIRD